MKPSAPKGINLGGHQLVLGGGGGAFRSQHVSNFTPRPDVYKPQFSRTASNPALQFPNQPQVTAPMPVKLPPNLPPPPSIPLPPSLPPPPSMPLPPSLSLLPTMLPPITPLALPPAPARAPISMPSHPISNQLLITGENQTACSLPLAQSGNYNAMPHPPSNFSSAQFHKENTRQLDASYNTKSSNSFSQSNSFDNSQVNSVNHYTGKRQRTPPVSQDSKVTNFSRNSKRKLRNKPGSSKQDESLDFVRMHPKAENIKVTFQPQVTSTPKTHEETAPEEEEESMPDCPKTPEWKLPESESDSGLDSESDTDENSTDFPFRINRGKELYPQSRVPFIDTHCHLDYMFVKERHHTSFKSFIQKKDFPYNFSGCITCFCDPPSINDDSYYKDVLSETGVWGTFGLHPHNAPHYNEKLLEAIKHANTHPKSLAWGEIGLDYTSKTTDEEKHVQQRAFVGQLRAAVDLGKPVVIHGRCSHEDTFSLLKQYCPSDHRIHYHCFSASLGFAERLNEFFPNLFIGIAGLITYNNPELENVVKEFPFDRVLVETDAPYMRPFYRKFLDRSTPRVSTPGMGVVIAQKIAEVKELDLDDVLIQMRENVTEMYGI